MRSRFNKLFLTGAFLAMIACSKEKTYESIPVITMDAVSATSIHAFTDSLIFTIGYTDGDGDFGENAADVKNCFVRDNAEGITYAYRIQQLAPSSAAIAIKGRLNVKMDHVAVSGTATSYTKTFTIYVVDRAGNKSNTVVSAPVTVTQ